MFAATAGAAARVLSDCADGMPMSAAGASQLPARQDGADCSRPAIAARPRLDGQCAPPYPIGWSRICMPTRRELANVLRALAMDAVQQAQSGHAGAPMGMADIAEALWRGFLKHNPADPHWWDRDRFVLSNGHACM